MSRVAKAPVALPNGVSVTLNDRQVEVKGKNGNITPACIGRAETGR